MRGNFILKILLHVLVFQLHKIHSRNTAIYFNNICFPENLQGLHFILIIFNHPIHNFTNFNG